MSRYNQAVMPSINDQAGNLTVTEQDLIRQLIEGSETKSANYEQSLKLCMRIWSGYSKFIRSQCNKDRVIDSLYFGSFLKKDVPASIISETADAKN